MKSKVLLLPLLIGIFTYWHIGTLQAQTEKKSKKNLIVKEWNLNAATQTKFLDHETTYNELGLKIEEVEYANYGFKSKVTFEYDENKKCTREVEYDSRGKVVKIKKFEYNADGTKKCQYTYSPAGKLESTKSFEYIYQEEK